MTTDTDTLVAELRRVLSRLENGIATWSGDWSTDDVLAYIFAAVGTGWDEASLREMSSRHGAAWITAMRQDRGVLDRVASALEQQAQETERLREALRRHHAHGALTASDEDRIGYFVTVEHKGICKVCGETGLQPMEIEAALSEGETA